MQVLVLYYTRTGNTESLARAVAKGVESVTGVSALLKHAAQVEDEDFLSSQGIIAGSPVYYGSMASELKRVFDRTVGIRDQMPDKVGAAFATSGDLTGGKETTIMSILQFMLISGMIIVGDPMEATGHYGTACAGEPDAKALEYAGMLGARVAELVKKLGS